MMIFNKVGQFTHTSNLMADDVKCLPNTICANSLLINSST